MVGLKKAVIVSVGSDVGLEQCTDHSDDERNDCAESDTCAQYTVSPC